MPRVQGWKLHTTFLPYIYAKFPGRDPSRGNRLYFCMDYHFRPEEIDELYVVSDTNIRQFFHFVQVFGFGKIKNHRISPVAWPEPV